MIQLFKAKSLKNNTKTGQGAGVGAGVRGASVQGADNKNAKKQRGRSMVEMLGVLAIIGVLSIGGIQGYTMAMRKYRANEILNVANKYAAILYASCQQAREQNPTAYPVATEQYLSPFNSLKFDSVYACPDDISFISAGLGSLPNGALTITGTNSSFGFYDYGSGNHSSAYIRTENGVDVVFISIKLDSQELCETILNTAGDSKFSSWAGDDNDMGGGYATNGGLGSCQGHGDWGETGDTTWVVVPFMFN